MQDPTNKFQIRNQILNSYNIVNNSMPILHSIVIMERKNELRKRNEQSDSGDIVFQERSGISSNHGV